VQPGDFLYLPTVDTGPWHLIVAVHQPDALPSGAADAPYIDINSGSAYGATLTPPIPPYLISRGTRLLAGEETLQMPQDVVIDMRSGWSLPTMGPGTFLDILFSPTGGLVADPSTSTVGSPEKIVLWVRDLPQNPDVNPATCPFPDPRGTPMGTPPTDPKSIPTEQSLIVVYSRTGLIAAHPPAMNPSNPDLADDPNLGPGHVSRYQFAQDGQSSGL
jgi:hypothetical protein